MRFLAFIVAERKKVSREIEGNAKRRGQEWRKAEKELEVEEASASETWV